MVLLSIGLVAVMQVLPSIENQWHRPSKGLAIGGIQLIDSSHPNGIGAEPITAIVHPAFDWNHMEVLAPHIRVLVVIPTNRTREPTAPTVSVCSLLACSPFYFQAQLNCSLYCNHRVFVSD